MSDAVSQIPVPFALTVEEVLGVAPDAFVSVDGDWRFVYVNEAAESLLDRRAADLLGKDLWDEFPDAVDSTFSREYERAVREQATVRFTEFFAPLGRWFEVQAVPQRLGLSIFFHDVTTLREAEQRAARLAARHASLQVVTTAMAAGADQATFFDLVCQETRGLVDAAGAQLVRFEDRSYEVMATMAPEGGGHPAIGERFDVPPDGDLARARDGEVVVVASDAGAVLVPVRHASEVWGCLSVTWAAAVPIDSDTVPWLRKFGDLVAVSLDIAATRADLARQAATDPLTGLANLRALHAELDGHLRHGHPRGGSVALAIIDVDSFKQVNDGFGHEVGDGVLKAVAARLHAACRVGDVAARVGGDEFAMVLSGCDTATALVVAERVRKEIETTSGEPGLPAVTVSVGVCAWEPGATREIMQRQADDALYWAKLHGRNASWSYIAELMDGGGSLERIRALRRAGAAIDPAATEEGVQAAQTFWQGALDGLSKHIAILDGDGRVIATNLAWRRFAAENGGDPEATGIGADYLAVCARSDADPVARDVADRLREVIAGTREDFELDYPCHAPDEERWFTVRASRFGPGNPVRVIVHHQNITARRRAENESAFRATLLDSIAVPVFANDAEGLITYWNAACESLYGRTAQEVIGRSVRTLGVFELADDHRATTRQRLADGLACDLEVISANSTGRRFGVAVNIAPLRDARGALTGTINTVFDLTERNAYQRDLRAARDYLRTVTESIAEGLLVFDGTGVATYANPAARALLADDELAGKPMADALYGGAPSRHAAALLSPSAGESAGIDSFRRADGTEIPVEWTASSFAHVEDPTLDAHAGGSRVVVFRDTTERRNQEQRLQAAHRQLERRASHQTALAELGTMALRGMATDELMHEAARLVKTTLGAEVTGVLPYATGGGLEIGATAGDADSMQPPEAARPNEPDIVMEHMRDKSDPLVIGDLRVSAIRAPVLQAEGMVSLIVAPVGAPVGRHGLLGACSRSSNAFTGEDVAFLQAMANTLAGAVERARAADDALRREAQLNEAQRLSNTGSWEVDLESGAVVASDHLRQMLALGEGPLQAEDLFARVHSEDRDLLSVYTDAAAGHDAEATEVRYVAPDGETRMLRSESAEVLVGDRGTRVMRGTLQDVTEARRAEDGLRRSEERFRQGFDNAPIGMTLIDPASGRFLRVNDAYCRLVGRSAEELLKLTYRAVVVPDEGEESVRDAFFDGDGAVLTTEARYLRPDGEMVWASINSSRVLGPDGKVDVLYSQVVDITARRVQEQAVLRDLERVAWLKEIHAALAEDRFELFGQPIVDLATGKTIQHELLLRMRSPAGELIAPGEFLPVAEQYGLIRDIDRWVISRGAEIAATGLDVEINLSGTSMSDASAIVDIDTALERTGADPARLVFEITETAAIEDDDNARRLAQGLRDRGCRFALDDFGTGFSGMSSLKSLPLDYLKIDREFVKDLSVNETDRHVLVATVKLAQAFGLQTIAEGVEDKRTLDLLRELGVDHAQGYFLGRPAPLPV